MRKLTWFCGLVLSSSVAMQTEPGWAQEDAAVAANVRPMSDARPLTLLEVVQTTLREHPGIQSARADLGLREAELRSTEGPFDPVLTASMGHSREAVPVLPSQRLTVGHESTLSDTTSLGLGAFWGTTWGTVVSPSVGIDRIHQRAGNGIVVPGFPSNPYHAARVDLTVTQALLRGAGRTGAASAIEAARFNREASEHLIAHTSQQQVLQAIAAYWQFVAAGEFVSLLAATRAGAEKLLSDTKILVESDQRPRSDLRQLEGNLAVRTRELEEAKNNQLQALYMLYQAMGVGIDRAEPRNAADGFPLAQAPAEDARAIVERARAGRRDILALERVVESTQANLRGAEKNTQPALDLSVSVGYNAAIDEDGPAAFFAAPGSNIPGVSGGVGLSLELPVSNTAAKATRDIQSAQREQAAIALADLRRRVPLDVLSALEDLRLSATALQSSSQAVEHYEQALKDERDRLREGISTVIDVVLTQEQLIRTQQARTNDHARYAVAAARLRYEMGRLPSQEQDALGAVTEMLGPRPPVSPATQGGSSVGQ